MQIQFSIKSIDIINLGQDLHQDLSSRDIIQILKHYDYYQNFMFRIHKIDLSILI